MNLFYKLWTEAKQGKNPFKATFFPWTANPTRDAKWEKDQLTSIGAIKFRQEVSCLHGDTMVTVRNKVTGVIEDVPFKVLEERLNKVKE